MIDEIQPSLSPIDRHLQWWNNQSGERVDVESNTDQCLHNHWYQVSYAQSYHGWTSYSTSGVNKMIDQVEVILKSVFIFQIDLKEIFTHERNE